MRAIKDQGTLPDGGVTVWIRGGTYLFDTTLSLGAEDSGSEGAPVVYRASVGEEVVFDGSNPIDAAAFQRVEDEETLERLCPVARGHVVRVPIGDADMVQALAGSGTRLSIDGRMMQLAQFPNVGYCHIDEILDPGAVYAHGRTLGDVPKYSMEAPVGGVFTIAEEPSGDWSAEFRRAQRARVRGYLSYDWYREGHRIASIQDGAIKLLEYSRYGVLGREKIPRRLVVLNLLCELDQPGEWYFDEEERVLFLWPFEPMHAGTRLGYWSGPAFAVLNDASHIIIRDLTVQCTTAGDGMIVVKGGADNLVAGCTLRNSTRTGVVLSGGTGNGMVGCDLYDLGSHLVLAGGDLKTLTAAGNYARNNHLTQVESRDLYGRVRVHGVGNAFQNNLLHNFVGQPITIGGNDHLFERNEIFNVGIEEGDGGAMYSGAQMWSYGNVYRHNFLHHLMCVPQAHPRGGIYPDDLDAGDTIVENVFYKAAHRAVLLNGGAANTASHNIFIRGHIGIYCTEAWARGIIEAQPKYDSGELKRGDKTDHIWRTEQVVGKEGWNKPPWSAKYPLFKKVMSQPDRRFYPIECTVSHNLFCENTQNTAFRRGWHDKGLVAIEEIDYVEAANNREIPFTAFVDPGCLDFRFREGARPGDFPEIPFGTIGLYADEYRTHVPEKVAYRRAIAEKWDERKSYDEEALYVPKTVNETVYFNTGKLVLQAK
ncbi:MAG: right-handed parallel beta-helix repeat-containing protein [bacterium]|nr:right-handed parallel beta-helix repeat-containing protein [bacterium]